MRRSPCRMHNSSLPGFSLRLHFQAQYLQNKAYERLTAATLPAPVGDAALPEAQSSPQCRRTRPEQRCAALRSDRARDRAALRAEQPQLCSRLARPLPGGCRRYHGARRLARPQPASPHRPPGWGGKRWAPGAPAAGGREDGRTDGRTGAPGGTATRGPGLAPDESLAERALTWRHAEGCEQQAEQRAAAAGGAGGGGGGLHHPACPRRDREATGRRRGGGGGPRGSSLRLRSAEATSLLARPCAGAASGGAAALPLGARRGATPHRSRWRLPSGSRAALQDWERRRGGGAGCGGGDGPAPPARPAHATGGGAGEAPGAAAPVAGAAVPRAPGGAAEGERDRGVGEHGEPRAGRPAPPRVLCPRSRRVSGGSIANRELER